MGLKKTGLDGVDWIYVVEDTYTWQDLVDTEINFRAS
jgi:hypothetical protein